MAHPIADCAFITDRDRRDVVISIILRNAATRLANDNCHLPFIIKRLVLRWPNQGLIMPRKPTRETRKQRHIFRRRSRAILILRIAIRKVHADAKNTFRVGQNHLELIVFMRDWTPLCDLFQLRQGPRFNHIQQGRPLRTHRIQRDHAALCNSTIETLPIGRKACKIHDIDSQTSLITLCAIITSSRVVSN